MSLVHPLVRACLRVCRARGESFVGEAGQERRVVNIYLRSP